MPRFQHHPDGVIFINDNAFPLDWFLEQEPAYVGLPDGAIGRLYVPGKRHHITMVKDDDVIYQNPGDEDENHLWDEGDAYIANLQTYVDAYDLFANPPPTPPTQEELDEQFNQDINIELRTLDINSIRAIREWIAKQPDAPQELKDHESKAINKRKKIKK